MALYYKKVDAIQFNLTDEQKTNIHDRKPVLFEGYPVRHVGGENYLAVLQQGENLHRIYNTQWLIRHGDGAWQIISNDHFGGQFIAGNETDTIKITKDPFTSKSYNQPNTII